MNISANEQRILVFHDKVDRTKESETVFSLEQCVTVLPFSSVNPPHFLFQIELDGLLERFNALLKNSL